jgi:subtilisin family serine protease
MKRLILTWVAVLTAAVLTAGGQHSGKLSAWVQERLSQQHHMSHRAGEEKPELVTVFIQLMGGQDVSILTPYGCKVYAQLGDICIATVPLDQLDALSELPDIKRVEASASAHTTLDDVVSVVNALPVYQATDVHQAFTGRNVVVGVMDVGFDLTHPTFFGDQQLQQYRIKTFWDQLAPCSDSERFPVGCEYADEQTILSVGRAVDGETQNHGTHTSGTAAGSGYDTPYRGLAFESDLALVANAVTADAEYIQPQDQHKYTTATDALGFKYLFDYAQREGKPCVVSFSEGYTPFMDDDDLLYSLFLERLTGPGRILVASAGNENVRVTYMTKPTGVEAAGSFLNASSKEAAFRLLCQGTPVVRLLRYQGQESVSAELRMDWAEGDWEDDELADTLFVTSADDQQRDTCAVSVIRYTSDLISGQTMYYMALTGNVELNLLGTIALVVEGTDCDVQVFGNSSSPLANLDTDSRWNAAQAGHNVLAPGCLAAPICVGATVHRLAYTNAAGKEVKYDRPEELGQWACFSSTGPTMGGLSKPDIVAPGCNVISSYSSYYMETHPTKTDDFVAYTTIGDRTYPWGGNSGTSMSTPVVAGAIALWLQANPLLTREDIIGVLQRTSRHPEEQLDYPNPKYGYGEIDVYRGLLDILDVTAIQGVSMHQPQGVQFSMTDGRLTLTLAHQPMTTMRLTVYTTDGRQQLQHTWSDGRQEMTVDLSSLPHGVYAVQVDGDKLTTGSQLIRR